MLPIMAFCLLTACEDKIDSVLVTDATQLVYDYEGGTQELTIHSNTDWSIKTTADWIQLSAMSGSMSQTVTVVAMPPEDPSMMKEATLIVHTNDGEKTVNVNVRMKGMLYGTEKLIRVLSGASILLNGQAGSTESVKLASNTKWEVRGPSWLEAWDGNRWRTLSKERGLVTGEGSAYIQIRALQSNTNIDDLEDNIIIQEQLTGYYQTAIKVYQMGCEKAYPHYAIFGNGIAFDWVCGCNVRQFYFTVKEGLDSNVFHTENAEVQQNWELTDVSYVNSIPLQLKNGYYTIATRAMLSDGSMSTWTYTCTYTLSNLEESALAPIGRIVYDDLTDIWWMNISLNEYCVSSNFFISTNPTGMFQYNDPLVNYLISQDSRAAEYGKRPLHDGWQPMWNVSGKVSELHIMSIGIDASVNMASLVSRIDKYYDAKGNELPAKPLLDRCPKAIVGDVSLR